MSTDLLRFRYGPKLGYFLLDGLSIDGFEILRQADRHKCYRCRSLPPLMGVLIGRS